LSGSDDVFVIGDDWGGGVGLSRLSGAEFICCVPIGVILSPPLDGLDGIIDVNFCGIVLL